MDNIILTPQQQAAFDNIIKSLDNGQNYCLQGYAGTGKSTLCRRIVEHYGAKNVVLTAPTHKASNVLQELTSGTSQTIHSLLKLVPKKGKLVQTSNKTINTPKVVIIDECSMIDDELLGFIERCIDSPILFVGDPAQLPPVANGQNISSSFNTENKSVLTDIVRQAKGNPFISYSVTLRNEGFCKEKVPFDKQHIVQLNPESVISNALKIYERGGITAAWTNATVDYINFGCHDSIYKEGSDYTVGEKLIVGSPVLAQNGSDVLIDNGDIVTVLDIKAGIKEESKKEVVDVLDIPVWDIKIENSKGETVTIQTIRRSSKTMYDAYLKRMADRLDWNRYYRWKESIIDVKHCYAMTCHKLQGSTYPIVAVAVRDILQCRDEATRNKLMYVAMTRASNKIGLYL